MWRTFPNGFGTATSNRLASAAECADHRWFLHVRPPWPATACSGIIPEHARALAGHCPLPTIIHPRWEARLGSLAGGEIQSGVEYPYRNALRHCVIGFAAKEPLRAAKQRIIDRSDHSWHLGVRAGIRYPVGHYRDRFRRLEPSRDPERAGWRGAGVRRSQFPRRRQGCVPMRSAGDPGIPGRRPLRADPSGVPLSCTRTP